MSQVVYKAKWHGEEVAAKSKGPRVLTGTQERAKRATGNSAATVTIR